MSGGGTETKNELAETIGEGVKRRGTVCSERGDEKEMIEIEITIKKEPMDTEEDDRITVNYEPNCNIKQEVDTYIYVKVEKENHDIKKEMIIEPKVLQQSSVLKADTPENSSELKHCHICSQDLSVQSTSRTEHKCANSENTAREKETPTNGRAELRCEFCQKTFRYNSYFVSHLRTHSGEKPFQCRICKKQFVHKSDLTRHVVRIHSGEKLYSCELCEKPFGQKIDLVRHVRIVHCGDKPYHCETCKKQFSQKSDLICHERIHSGEKPFHCGVCNKGFARKSRMTEHERIHSNERPFQCETCSYQFARRADLTRHNLVHRGIKRMEKIYFCGICNKQCNSKSNLNEHERIHSGVKPYHCDVCKTPFAFKSSLNRHKLMNKCPITKKVKKETAISTM